MSNYPSTPTSTTSDINVTPSTPLVVSGGQFLRDNGSALNDGTITVAGRLSVAGDYTGSGSITVENGGRVGIGGVASNTGTFVFSGTADVLDEDTPGTFSPVLTGLVNGDRLALSPISGVAAASATITPDGAGLETVTYAGTMSGGGTATFTFTVATATLPPGAAFVAQNSVANNGIGIDLLVTCFLAGTRIRTPDGERAVEDLAIGDPVTTAAGGAEPVKWIGRRSYAGRFLRSNPGAQPVLVRAGALADGIPTRDLYLSANHALAIDGVLIPAQSLVNGRTIQRVTGLDRVDYFHIELEGHDIILAEGAPAETFLDDDSRGAFQNAHDYAALYPPSPRPAFCLPRLDQGYALESIRRRLDARAEQIAA